MIVQIKSNKKEKRNYSTANLKNKINSKKLKIWLINNLKLKIQFNK